jgi:protein ERP2
VNAGDRECFYERVEENHIIDIEYQVIDGGHGDLDINFELSVDNRIIYVDYKKSDNIHRFEQPHPAADYKFCFDNTISHFNRKTVFFELLTEDPDNPTAGEFMRKRQLLRS